MSNAICGKTSLRQRTFIRDLPSKLLKFSFFAWCVECWKLASTSVPVLRGQHSNLFASVNINTRCEEVEDETGHLTIKSIY